MIQKLFTILENGIVRGSEEVRTYLKYIEDTKEPEYMILFNQFHLPGRCEVSSFVDGDIYFFDETGEMVDTFAEATKDIYLDILEQNKSWIIEQIESGIYEVEHEHMLSYEFYIDSRTKEIVVIECWGTDSHRGKPGLKWLYRLGACYRDWEDYVFNKDAVDAEEIYNEMCSNVDESNRFRKGVYVTSTGKRGAMNEIKLY